MITIIWVALIVLGLVFTVVLARDIIKHKNVLEKVSTYRRRSPSSVFPVTTAI